MGVSMISAISLYENPSTSASRTGIRKFSGRDSSAVLMSGAAHGPPGAILPHPLEEVQILELAELDLGGPTCLSPIAVDERVGEDPIQPGAEVGSGLERVIPAVRLEERLLEDVFGIGRVARHPQRSRVELREELHDIVFERGLIGHSGPFRAGFRSTPDLGGD
jgi:hypothetical protein